MKDTIQTYPPFPKFAKLPEADIPPEVLKYCLDSWNWKNRIEKELRDNLTLSKKVSAPQNKYAVGYQTAIKEFLGE